MADQTTVAVSSGLVGAVAGVVLFQHVTGLSAWVSLPFGAIIGFAVIAVLVFVLVGLIGKRFGLSEQPTYTRDPTGDRTIRDLNGVVQAADQETAEVSRGDLYLFLFLHLIYGAAYVIPCAIIGYGVAGIWCQRLVLPSKWHGSVEHLGLSAILWSIFVINGGVAFLFGAIAKVHFNEDSYPERVIKIGLSVFACEAIVIAVYLYLYGFPQDF